MTGLNTGSHTMETEILARGIVSLGNAARLQRVCAKAAGGEPIVIGAIGGSITWGAKASTREKAWAPRVARWWEERYPDTIVTFVNAGLGGTGSNVGAHRAQHDLLSHEPDLVLVEFGVNDGGNEYRDETFEGLLRRILSSKRAPAVVLFFTMRQDGGNVQDAHALTGRHYGLPMCSVRDALWPEIETGSVRWEQYSPDGVHPNDWGHQVCAACVTTLLEHCIEAGAGAGGPVADSLPAPLHGTIFEQADFRNAETIVPTRIDGWQVGPPRRLGPCWQSATPGSVMEFDLAGRSLSIGYHKIQGPMGIALATVDELPPVELDAWYEATWGGYLHWTMLAHDIEPGPHKVRIQLTDRHAPRSNGHEFEIRALFTAG